MGLVGGRRLGPPKLRRLVAPHVARVLASAGRVEYSARTAVATGDVSISSRVGAPSVEQTAVRSAPRARPRADATANAAGRRGTNRAAIPGWRCRQRLTIAFVDSWRCSRTSVWAGASAGRGRRVAARQRPGSRTIRWMLVSSDRLQKLVTGIFLSSTAALSGAGAGGRQRLGARQPRLDTADGLRDVDRVLDCAAQNLSVFTHAVAPLRRSGPNRRCSGSPAASAQSAHVACGPGEFPPRALGCGGVASLETSRQGRSRQRASDPSIFGRLASAGRRRGSVASRDAEDRGGEALAAKNRVIWERTRARREHGPRIPEADGRR